MARTKEARAAVPGLPGIKTPALRYFGGKFRLSAWIRSFFPPHRCYVESFGGAGSVLLTKERAYAEVFNDLDGDIVNFFRVLRDPASRAQLIEACELTPFAREEFEESFGAIGNPIERARRLAIRAQMGFGSAGGSKSTTGFRIDTGRQYSTDFQHWARYPAGLAAVGDRFTAVLIENRPAIDVMLQHDSPVTLHYVDPPYLHSTRVRASVDNQRYYRHEMSDWQHMDLLAALQNLQGMVVLSGYHSEMYAKALNSWEHHKVKARISQFRGTGMRMENVWLNEACARALAQVKKGE
jgi:DNA adenine methylase